MRDRARERVRYRGPRSDRAHRGRVLRACEPARLDSHGVLVPDHGRDPGGAHRAGVRRQRRPVRGSGLRAPCLVPLLPRLGRDHDPPVRDLDLASAPRLTPPTG